jgi:hypothetical protein
VRLWKFWKKVDPCSDRTEAIQAIRAPGSRLPLRFCLRDPSPAVSRGWAAASPSCSTRSLEPGKIVQIRSRRTQNAPSDFGGCKDPSSSRRTAGDLMESPTPQEILGPGGKPFSICENLPVHRRSNRSTTWCGKLISSISSSLSGGQDSGSRIPTIWFSSRRIARTAVEFAEGFQYLVDRNGRLEALGRPQRGA